ncbi:MAG: alpha/beta hydrolase [Alkalilacustris sp.]
MMGADTSRSGAALPHGGGAVLRAGASGSLGMVWLHGRGGRPDDILDLAPLVGLQSARLVAPTADGASWWPVSFLAPMSRLQPWLDGALAAVDRAVALLQADGIARDRIAVVGFSQGGCLALEWAARRGGPLAGVAGLSSGLVGTEDAAGGPDPALFGHAPKRMGQRGRLDGVPVWLGCHAEDPHIPRPRVEDSAAILAQLGARVDLTIHPGAGHGITQTDIAALRAMLAG